MNGMQHILLMGDSLTQRGYSSGWVGALSDVFIRRANVVNAGLSGYNTRWVLKNLQCSAPYIAPIETENSNPPLFVTLWLGANDAAFEGNYQHVPLAEYESNLRALVEWIRAYQRPKYGLLLITPPPCDGLAWAAAAAKQYGSDPTAINRTLSVTREYRNAVISVGKDLDVPVVDMFKAFGVEEDDNEIRLWSSNFHDGLHFSKEGDAIAFEAIMHSIRADLKLDPLAIPFAMPPHTDFNVQQPPQ